jgi:uncharacterized membrane protein
MKIRFPYLFIALSAGVALWLSSSCTTDKLSEPQPIVEVGFCDTIPATYDGLVKEIIDLNCAYSGCHLASPVAPGNYTTYEGLQNIINSGEFELRVITERADEEHGMPPYYVPNGKPEDLTEMELDIIRCWIDAGYPES